MKKYIQYSFYTLAFLLPLTFFTKTSELFEFNKMILVYLLTILITSLWISRFIIEEKIVFKKHYLNIFILIFLAAMGLSTLVSIDFRTSLLGYYSRFHGGLVSYISYSILFFAYINNFDKKSSLQFIKVVILSTFIASIYAAVEHFGISFSCLFVTGNLDVQCWVQDVQDRVFGTFGQPNWLAAWLVAVIPLSWYLILNTRSRIKSGLPAQAGMTNLLIYFFCFCLFATTLYFTKSRSAFIALIISYFVFWGSVFYIKYFTKTKTKFDNLVNFFVIITSFLLLITLFINTPWQPNVNSVNAQEVQEYVAPALEYGGTESGDIRKIVWKGGLDLFKKYPLLGTGLDTFAFSYYETRPMEHNMTSEWNYIYNRAHNEYINFLATTGLIGTLSYAFLIFAIIYLFLKNFSLLNSALLASFVSILVTNFFGFSTVGVGFLFFMLPAISIASDNKNIEKIYNLSINNKKIFLIIIASISFVFLVFVYRYWLADFYYAKGKQFSRSGNQQLAISNYEKAINLNSSESNFYNDLSQSYIASGNIERSVDAMQKAIQLSPHNVAIHKQVANTYSKLSNVNPDFLNSELQILEKLRMLAPTDPSVQYKYASFLARNGLIDESIKELKVAIEMKPDYKIAATLLAYIYEDTGEIDLAREQYEYILNFYPNDEKIREDLESLNDD